MRSFRIARNYEIILIITRLRDYEISNLAPAFRNFDENFEIARARLRNFVISCWSFIGIISYCDTQHEITKFRNFEITRLRDYEITRLHEITRFRNFEITRISKLLERDYENYEITKLYYHFVLRHYEITRLRIYEIARARLRNFVISKFRNFIVWSFIYEALLISFRIAKFRLHSDNYEISKLRNCEPVVSFIGIISYCDTQHEITKFRNYEITRLRDYEITRFRNFEIASELRNC